MSAFGGKADIGQRPAATQDSLAGGGQGGLLQLAIDLRMAILELQRLERVLI